MPGARIDDTDSPDNRDAAGRTKARMFRLSERSLAELDQIAHALAEETGEKPTRSNALRRLIREEYTRRFQPRPTTKRPAGKGKGK